MLLHGSYSKFNSDACNTQSFKMIRAFEGVMSACYAASLARSAAICTSVYYQSGAGGV